MGNISGDVISILQFLLPGFVTAWIFYSLTSHQKPTEFERIVQALIFTLFIKALLVFLELLLQFINISWSADIELISSVVFAILIGFIVVYLSNSDKFFEVLRKFGITKESSFSSEWSGAFSNNVTYIVIHFKDERRLYGWPIYWPSEPNRGHFLMLNPTWLSSDDGETSVEVPISGVSHILIDVKWVEFMEQE